jgi:hypothetical protein
MLYDQGRERSSPERMTEVQLNKLVLAYFAYLPAVGQPSALG